ncbi:dCTP deaminase [Nitrosomonas supralitoralis]|uniref:dCTP deaminase n=1 Tax=Nitrosomonas supralitoralis TaxID=2116706 RepID=A0A2P7NRF9_9PROT|nr:dCTP deaminase [Nitrosomonas supralitoralis]PSJ16076.1 dCTP deaminase [Nitrosomonas supralitoralis]
MNLLRNERIRELLSSQAHDSLFIDPLLEDSQVGAVTLDLRLGYDFLVSILTRKPSIDTSVDQNHLHRAIGSYFQETRRELGERFVLYPHQIVLCTTLEYVSLPHNIYADILSRSSYTRLGVPVNTMVQPGFRGCVPLELFNHGNSPVELIVGSRICQARFFEIDGAVNYIEPTRSRKYFGHVRPVVSAADMDCEIKKLRGIAERL